MVVLWEQMVVNNWPIVLEGCATVPTVGWAGSLVFFISFYLVTVITVMNVLIAYLLDAYQNQVELKKEAEGNENSEGGSLAWNVNLNRVAVENGVDISGLRIRHQMSTDAMLLYIHVENLKQEASFVEDETLGDAILNPGHKYSQSIL